MSRFLSGIQGRRRGVAKISEASQVRLVSAMKVWFCEVHACSHGRPRRRFYFVSKSLILMTPIAFWGTRGHQGAPKAITIEKPMVFHGFWEAPRAPRGPPRAPQGPPLGPLRPPLASLGALSVPLGLSWAPLGTPLGSLGCSLGPRSLDHSITRSFDPRCSIILKRLVSKST